MNPITRNALALIVLGSASGCSSATSTAATNTTSRAGDEAAIRALNDSVMAAMQARDAGGITAYYAPNGQLFPPNRAVATGLPAIQASWAGDFQLPNIDLSFESRRIDVAASGDMASDVGTYRVSLDDPSGRISDTGKYVVVWRKVSGEWKIMADIWNSDLPLPPPAAETALAVAAPAEAPEMEIAASARLKWAPLEVPGFKSGLQMAVIHGDPSGTGDYTVRLRFPDGYDFPSHWHPNGEHVTVLRGTFKLGMGAREEPGETKSYKAGDFLYIPAKMPHFGGATGVTEIQLHGMGPFAINLSSQSSSR